MKVNLDFYKKEKEISEVEKEILNYIKNNDKNDYEKILQKDNRIDVVLALSDIRENIINWYPFKKNSTILEIGADFGQITGALCKRANKVVAFEICGEKRKAISDRYKEIQNLHIIDDLEKIENKFDYITVIGVERTTDTPEEMLEELKKFLKEDGKILIATDNRLALKYFSSTDETGENITNLINKKLYTLEELENQIEEAGFKNKRVYYPMTDYKLTNVIYTSEKPLSINNMSRNIVYSKEDTIKFYEQNNAYRELLNKEDFNKFINSFFIEIFNGEYEKTPIKMVAFSNMRKPEYRIKTILDSKEVYKYAINEKSKTHIENVKKNIDIMKKSNLKTVDSYDDEKIISQYTNTKTVDKIILDLIKKDKEEAKKIIKKFKQEITEKLEIGNIEKNVFDKYNLEYDKNILENETFVKNGLWDLIFQNCFYVDNEFYFYDQEWMEENVPINFILYRAIKYFVAIKKYITEEELYNILEINKETIELFEILDNKLQENIRDELIWKINTQGKTMIDLKRDKLTDNNTINLLQIEKNELLKQIKELQDELNYVYNSKSWKITKPLRKIRKLSK